MSNKAPKLQYGKKNNLPLVDTFKEILYCSEEGVSMSFIKTSNMSMRHFDMLIFSYKGTLIGKFDLELDIRSRFFSYELSYDHFRVWQDLR